MATRLNTHQIPIYQDSANTDSKLPPPPLAAAAAAAPAEQPVVLPPAASTHEARELWSLLELVLRLHCTRLLPQHMRPCCFLPTPALPLTPSGKLARGLLPTAAQCREWRGARAANIGQSEIECPRHLSAVEAAVAAAWARVLGLPASSLRGSADWLRLGGHSLAALRVVQLLEPQLQQLQAEAIPAGPGDNAEKERHKTTTTTAALGQARAQPQRTFGCVPMYP